MQSGFATGAYGAVLTIPAHESASLSREARFMETATMDKLSKEPCTKHFVAKQGQLHLNFEVAERVLFGFKAASEQGTKWRLQNCLSISPDLCCSE